MAPSKIPPIEFGPAFRVLDHGSVELVEAWGSDEQIVETARVSTQKGFLGWGPKGWECHHAGADGPCGYKFVGPDRPEETEKGCPRCGDGLVTIPGDEKLLRYLADHHHDTPFEFAGATFEVQAPIFVFREWHRHRTQSYSEASARYSPLPNVHYVPTIERLMGPPTGASKQAGKIKGANDLTSDVAREFQLDLTDAYVECERIYQNALAAGVPKELARLILPVGRYSRMRASANLRNWAHYLHLRLDVNAQWEIRQYAKAVHELLARAFPRTMDLLVPL